MQIKMEDMDELTRFMNSLRKTECEGGCRKKKPPVCAGRGQCKGPNFCAGHGAIACPGRCGR